MTLDSGTCAFCGFGDGRLGETGDEATQYLHAAVRIGKPGHWDYKTFPGARQGSMIAWCGECVGGLKHKFQRYDDTNLRALEMSYKVRMAMDGPRWIFWDLAGEKQDIDRQNVIDSGFSPDDIAVHMEKLRIESDLGDIQNELSRRVGFDLTTRGWRA